MSRGKRLAGVTLGKPHPIGSTVLIDGTVKAVVRRHGRDSQGTYTEVELPNGEVAKYNRERLQGTAGPIRTKANKWAGWPEDKS
jgi:hypothetical protein